MGIRGNLLCLLIKVPVHIITNFCCYFAHTKTTTYYPKKKNKLIFSFLLLLNCNCWFVFCLSIPSRPHVTDDTLRKKGKKKKYFIQILLFYYFLKISFVILELELTGSWRVILHIDSQEKKRIKWKFHWKPTKKKRNKSLVIGMNVFVVCVCHRSPFCSLFLIPSFLLFLFKKIVYRFSIEQQQNI